MADIYIIAGPPGIGKSTLGKKFIPSHLDILDQDEVHYRYKEKGEPYYNQHSTIRFEEMLKNKVLRGGDFALELNLGYEVQYMQALWLKHFRSENTLNVVLFFTDNINLCQDRAMARFKSGRHLVEPKTIQEMYLNTLPLLKDNFEAIDYLMLLDVNRFKKITPVATYIKEQKSFDISDNTPEWFRNDLQLFIQNRIDDDFLPKLDLGNPYEPDNDRPHGRKR